MSSSPGRGCTTKDLLPSAPSPSPACQGLPASGGAEQAAGQAGQCKQGEGGHLGRADFIYRLSFPFLPQLLAGMILEDNLTWSLFYSLLLNGWSISPGRKEQPCAWISLKYTCRHVQQLGLNSVLRRPRSIYNCFPPVPPVPPVLPVPPAPELPLQERVHDAALVQEIVVFLSHFLPGPWHNSCMEKRGLIEREMPFSPDALGIVPRNAPSPDLLWITMRWSTPRVSCNLAADHRALPTA